MAETLEYWRSEAKSMVTRLEFALDIADSVIKDRDLLQRKLDRVTRFECCSAMERLPRVEADRDRLREALSNIINEASDDLDRDPRQQLERIIDLAFAALEGQEALDNE